ncbi:LOW QUALITY PROTEIN: cilia- and flagella-associated protein 54 [Fundulus heteroclitus]|uniref:LOW QUALITY PROTEIN: cilia- and flagella-associated protein 54 n=1 Tax=Fundulus heteroclitus TaxID=8078 RepID=UPI00165A7F99|nr:LOW QUALITY PROTEIN: cilia- and flagella-associated protein 54 [Fundulus heteroclitus]
MDLPATYYGPLDRKNPVLSGFKRETESFITLMKQVTSTTGRDGSSFAKGIKLLADIRKKYKHRLPERFYQEHLLQLGDILCGFKLYQLALWHGYSLHLLHWSSVPITDITDVDHFMACYFPEGLDLDPGTVAMKCHAMLGCATCIFEEVKRCCTFSEKGLCKLLKVLNFLRIMMQAFQQHEHLCWQMYEGASSIYNLCRYLMTMNRSEQALEYLLWASICLELSVPLMTAKYLPLIATLYCSVCQCYFDNQTEEQAEGFAKRALGKINELAKLEEPTDATSKAYREASVKLAVFVFKRTVFDIERRPEAMQKDKTKSTLKDIPNAPWPRNPTEQMLTSQFDCIAGQFLGILEALWDSSTRPLQMTLPDDAKLLEVVLELLSAGMSILSGTSEQKCDDYQRLSPNMLTSASTQTDLVITGENKVSVTSAVRFIKLLFKHKQPEAFRELTKEMLHYLSGVEGQPFRRAERELALLHSFNNLPLPQRDNPKEDEKDGGERFFSSMSDELVGLVDALRLSVCGSDPGLLPDTDLVFDTLVFLWRKLKAILQSHYLEAPESPLDQEKMDGYDKWLWCLSVLCEAALVCELANVDCILTAEMILTLGKELERAADRADRTEGSAGEGCGDVRPGSFPLLERSSTVLLKKACEVTKKGLEALAEGVSALIPRDPSAVTDAACMQKCVPLHPPSASSTPSADQKGSAENIVRAEEEKEPTGESKNEGCHDESLFLVAKDLQLELSIIYHKASVKLLLLNEVAESDLLAGIKRNKVSKAHFMIQKASVEHSKGGANRISAINGLLKEASILLEKAELEDRKLYMASVKNLTQDKDKRGAGEKAPPPPILISRTDHSFTFAPAAYDLERRVSWYQLCGRAAQGANWKVRLADCSIPGTGDMVPVVSGECLLRAEGLQPNQKYVFAVAAYDGQGTLVGDTIGDTTLPVLACMPAPLLSSWAHLAQVAFQTEQHAVATRACRKLWGHYTEPDGPSRSGERNGLASIGLHKETLQHSSPHLCQMFLRVIFAETERNIQQASLHWDSFSDGGPFLWEQEARLAECDRMLLAMDLAIYANDGGSALQAVVTCYRLLAPLIYHQIASDPVVQVLRRCLVVLEENSSLLKQGWGGNSTESLLHMVACITNYLSKVLRGFREYQSAAAVLDCGRGLLQEVFDAQKDRSLSCQAGSNKVSTQAVDDGQKKISHQLKALHVKNIVAEAEPNKDNEVAPSLVTTEDPTVLYHLFSSCTLQDNYKHVMQLKRKTYFLEFAALLLQRTVEEGGADLTLDWGQSILQVLSRHDETLGLATKKEQESSKSKRGGNPVASKKSETPQIAPTHEELRKKLRKHLPRSLLRNLKTNREMRIVENMLSMMSTVVQRHKKQVQLRNLKADERAWRSAVNYWMAVAYLEQFYQGLEPTPGGQQEQRYSELDPRWFSLAYSGVLMRKDSLLSSEDEVDLKRESSLRDDVLTPKSEKTQEEAVRNDVPVAKEITDERKGSCKSAAQHTETEMSGPDLLLSSVKNAAIYLRRAMVLAHRGHHWTALQNACQTLWDQNLRLSTTIQQIALRETSPPVTADQLHVIFTPLLVLATDLMLDMLDKLQIWRFYDLDSTLEELESGLHFSAPLDDCFPVDLRWVRTLVMHSLEQLHNCGKWETLAHFALLYNSYTRERYALIILPLLVHSQRKLLERISSFGGPAVPQPHHVQTQNTTGEKITNRSYAGCQLLSGWTRNPEKPVRKKTARRKSSPKDAPSLKVSEMQLSMSLVCVPLDVEDTLSCHREALGKRPDTLQVLQHSRSLLVQLLASTQPCFAAQLPRGQGRGLSRPASQVSFSPAVLSSPDLLPDDPCEEDFGAPNAIYCRPISLNSTPTVAAAYANSIKYLQPDGHDSLKVLALHEKGNLHYYAGNLSAAHSCWSKAVDCAFHSSRVIQEWDGSSQDAVKKAGIWGCLLGAVLAAKIAQFVSTPDIAERTKCCLLSAHFLKCVLGCSMVHPRTDLQYSSYAIGDELFPGVNLFSEPHRLQVGATVASLHFVCHWLFAAGYHITLLPVLALYLHLVGPVCRDVQRTAEAKILKVRALTELCMFTEAIAETVQFTQGADVILPSGLRIAKPDPQPVRTFCTNKSLPDNVEALEDLINCDFTSEVCTLYGDTLCSRFNLARIQLILAISKSEPGCPESDSEESCANTQSREMDTKHGEQERLETQGSGPEAEEQKRVTFCIGKEKLSPKRIKGLLLEGASTLLSSAWQQLTSHTCSEAEKLELTVEFNFLKANIFLQQGNFALSSEIAISSLTLLQTSPVIVRQCPPGSEQDTRDCSESSSLDGDCPRAVEARERIGALLWLRCRLTLVQSLAADIPASAKFFPGNNVNEEIARLIQEGLDECVRWGDRDIQALLMVEAAELEAKRGRRDQSLAMLQKAVNLLSERSHMPPGSVLTLTRATLLLSDLREARSTSLLQLTQKLLEKQLCLFDQSVKLVDGNLSFSPPGPRNIYLPCLDMLKKVTVAIGSILNLGNMQEPDQSSMPSKSLHRSNKTRRDSQKVSPLSDKSS